MSGVDTTDKNYENSARIASNVTEVQNGYIANTDQDSYCDISYSVEK